MKTLIFIFSAFLIFTACTNPGPAERSENNEIIQQDSTKSIAVPDDSTDQKDFQTSVESEKADSNEIPPDGKYRYDIAFAEWEGKSMGEKVTVIIQGDSIKIVYEGDGQLTQTKKGDIIDQGLIIKHKSGAWIIGTQSDTDVDVYGGCSGGPAIIDFKNKKYWMC